MTTRFLRRGEAALVQAAVAAFPFKPYRNYRVYSRKTQTAVLLAEVEDALALEGGIAVTSGDGSAIAVGRMLEWDSRFFAVPMARVEYVIGSDPAAADRALDALLDALRGNGARHLTARADVADVRLVAALESRGFRLMDALVTYTTRPRGEPPKAVREVGAIRPLRAGDAPELVAIAAEAYRGYRGRFHLDPSIDDARADALYVEWAEQTVNGAMADTVFVAESGGRLLGFLGFRRREPVSSTGGVPVFGGGLGASRPDAPGAYAGLIRAGTIWAHEHGGVAECQTQNYNFAVIRVYEAVGAHYVRAEYTLHRWE